MLDTLILMANGFINALFPVNLLAMAIGVTIGIVIGCLPGLSAAMGVALLLPMTFSMDASTGMIMLGAIYCGAIFGGSISAILIHTPGTPASAATAIEGYQMTLKGQDCVYSVILRWITLVHFPVFLRAVAGTISYEIRLT